MFYQVIHQVIRKIIYSIIILLFICCNENTSQEKQIDKGKSEATWSYSVEETYKKYADSINELELNSEIIPSFITNYTEDFKSIESTSFHMSKSTVYNRVLNLCEVDKLEALIHILEQKETRNENENIVLKEAKYLITKKP